MNIYDDKYLSKLLKKGDEKAYDFLMDTYYQKLCSYAFSLTNDTFKTEDIVQNVMIKLWEQREKINFTISIKNYLYRSVYNEFIDFYRQNTKVIPLEKKYIEAIDSIVENDKMDIELIMNMVYKAINKLPKKCKQIFLLSKQEGLTHNEIAEHLNISVKTVEGHITRAFKSLNKELGDKINLFLFFITKWRFLNITILSPINPITNQ